MSSARSACLREIEARGFVHQITDRPALDGLLSAVPVTAYVGFDCTADSLHVGNLVSVMLLRTLERHGHRPVALVGGGTSKIGDPSGKDEARRLLGPDQLAANKAGIERSLRKYLDLGGSSRLVDNADWLDPLGYIAFLRDFGPHFTINRMLTFDSVRSRLEREQPLTLLEFNYMVMQAYDFLELSRRIGCRLQMGGSDQWGNIVNGVELARRVDGVQLFGLTTPLITTASGQKMGKTATGAVWLNENRRTPFEFWQFWRNTEDDDVGRFLRLFTELPLDEIARLERLEGAELNDAKVILATAATTLCHGAEEAGRAADAARAQFGSGGSLDGLPVVSCDPGRLAAGIPLVELLVVAALASSNGEARRLVRGGGARLNDERADDEHLLVTDEALVGGALKLSAGRKRHVLVRPG